MEPRDLSSTLSLTLGAFAPLAPLPPSLPAFLNFGVSHVFCERRGRWNSSYINHFTSPDTIIPNPYNSQSWDRYAYVNNNPVNATDPTGHQCVGEPGECLENDGTTGPGFPGTGDTVSNPGAGDCSGAGCQGEDDNDPSSNDVCDQILGCEDPDAGVFCDQYGCWYDADTDISGTYEDPAVYISLLAGGWTSGLFSASFWGTATACISNMVCRLFSGMVGGTGAAKGTIPDLTPEKLEHVFGNTEHKLGSLLASFNGDQQTAFIATYNEFAAVAGTYSQSQLASGIPVIVNNITVVVRGAIVDGIARIGTVFIP